MGAHDRNLPGGANAQLGIWGSPDSAQNFCEEDYAVTYYIAEFINSLTNLTYVYLAVRSRSLDFMSISLFLLGIGSFAYHATLRQAMQSVDDLSMMLLAWSMLQTILLIRQDSRVKRRLIIAGLATGVPLASAYYVKSGSIDFHAACFLSMMVLVTSRLVFLLHYKKPWFPAENVKAWSKRTLWSLGTSLFGYAIWHVDLYFCSELRAARDSIGLPFGWLLELHGWWHILTAIGASMFMDVAREMRYEAQILCKEHTN